MVTMGLMPPWLLSCLRKLTIAFLDSGQGFSTLLWVSIFWGTPKQCGYLGLIQGQLLEISSRWSTSISIVEELPRYFQVQPGLKLTGLQSTVERALPACNQSPISSVRWCHGKAKDAEKKRDCPHRMHRQTFLRGKSWTETCSDEAVAMGGRLGHLRQREKHEQTVCVGKEVGEREGLQISKGRVTK